MGQAAQVLNFFDADRDAPRRKSMSRMRIVNRNTLHLPLPSGNIVEPGESEIVVYDDEVAAVQAQVERNPDDFRLASEGFLTACANEVKEMIDWPHGLEELKKLIRSEENPRVNDAYKRLMRESHLSFEGKFTEIFGRSPLPLSSAEVIETGIAEPQRVGVEEEKKRFIEMMKEAGLGGNGLNLAAVQQVISEQVAAGVAAELRKHGIISSAPESTKPQTPPRK